MSSYHRHYLSVFSFYFYAGFILLLLFLTFLFVVGVLPFLFCFVVWDTCGIAPLCGRVVSPLMQMPGFANDRAATLYPKHVPFGYTIFIFCMFLYCFDCNGLCSRNPKGIIRHISFYISLFLYVTLAKSSLFVQSTEPRAGVGRNCWRCEPEYTI